MHRKPKEIASEKDCLTLLAQMCHGRKSGWVSLTDPPKLLEGPCPNCRKYNRKVRRKNRAPVLDYKCVSCGTLFNIFKGTPFEKCRRSPSELLVIIAGVARRRPTATMANELGCQRAALVTFRRKLQKFKWFDHLKESGQNALFAAGGVTLQHLLQFLASHELPERRRKEAVKIS